MSCRQYRGFIDVFLLSLVCFCLTIQSIYCLLTYLLKYKTNCIRCQYLMGQLWAHSLILEILLSSEERLVKVTIVFIFLIIIFVFSSIEQFILSNILCFFLFLPSSHANQKKFVIFNIFLLFFLALYLMIILTLNCVVSFTW